MSLSSDPKTLVTARNTVHLLNNHSGWHPVNGICLAWPSAARIMDKHDEYPMSAAELLDTYEASLRSTMQANFWCVLFACPLGSLVALFNTVIVSRLLHTNSRLRGP